MAYDTHTYYRTLTEAGVPTDQADAHARAQAHLMEDQFATRHDIDGLRHEMDLLRRDLETQMELLRRDMETQMGQLRSDMDVKMGRLEHRLTLRMGAGFAATIGILAALMAIL